MKCAGVAEGPLSCFELPGTIIAFAAYSIYEERGIHAHNPLTLIKSTARHNDHE